MRTIATCHRAYTHKLLKLSPMTSGRDIAVALRATNLALHRRSDLRFAKFGITADQFVSLATLARGDALNQRELAPRMTSAPSTVRAMLVLPEKRRSVRRDHLPTDSRARTVALTAKGMNAYERLWSAGKSDQGTYGRLASPRRCRSVRPVTASRGSVIESGLRPDRRNDFLSLYCGRIQ
jgi:DNA-binding MarR family transcriptional regulator